MEYLLYIAVLPVVLLLLFVYKKDPHPEPGKQVMKIFGFGCLTVIPALITEILMRLVFGDESMLSTFGLFMYYFVGVGLAEELYKWLVVRLFIYKSKHFEETYDALVYSVFSSLGFACVENIMYVFLNGGAATGIMRAFTSIPGHACFGAISGFFFAKAKKKEIHGESGVALQFTGLAISSLAHGLYDFMIVWASSGSVNPLVGILIIGLWILYILALFIICFVNVFIMAKKNERVAPYSPQELALMQPARPRVDQSRYLSSEGMGVPMVNGVPMAPPVVQGGWATSDSVPMQPNTVPSVELKQTAMLNNQTTAVAQSTQNVPGLSADATQALQRTPSVAPIRQNLVQQNVLPQAPSAIPVQQNVPQQAPSVAPVQQNVPPQAPSVVPVQQNMNMSPQVPTNTWATPQAPQIPQAPQVMPQAPQVMPQVPQVQQNSLTPIEQNKPQQ